MRTCVGCRREDRAADMVRMVLDPEGRIAFDLAGRAFGRGAWVHARPDCLTRAGERGVSRSFKQPVGIRATELWTALTCSADRRVRGLLSSARAAGRLAAGGDAVREHLEAGTARLVIVASDGRAAATTPWIDRAANEGRTMIWGTKASIGQAIGRGETAVVALLDVGLATAVARAAALAATPAPAEGSHERSRRRTADCTDGPPAAPSANGSGGSVDVLVEVR